MTPCTLSRYVVPLLVPPVTVALTAAAVQARGAVVRLRMTSGATRTYIRAIDAGSGYLCQARPRADADSSLAQSLSITQCRSLLAVLCSKRRSFTAVSTLIYIRNQLATVRRTTQELWQLRLRISE